MKSGTNIENPHAAFRIEFRAFGGLCLLRSPPQTSQRAEIPRMDPNKKTAKKNVLSDRLTDMLWRETDAGKKEYELELTMKAIDKNAQRHKTAITFVSNQELKSNF